MPRKIWSIAVAFLFIFCIATMANAQANGNQGENPGNGNQGDNPGNGNQGDNPGNGNQGDNPGNGNQGDNPGNGNQGDNPGNGNQGDNPGNGNQGDNPGNRNQGDNPGNGNQGENPGNGNQGETRNGNSSRRTPDGWTPAEEDTCDDLKHGTPGLYGLCIAFCEAHDCVPDFSDPNLDPYRNCKKNDRKILDKYRSKMRDGDPDMPCLPSAGEDPETACPCWSRDQLAYFPFGLSLSGVSDSGRWGQTDIGSTGDDDDCYQNLSYIGEYVVLSDGVVVHFDISAVSGDCDDGTYCSGSLFCEDGTCPDEVKPSNAWIDITPEEYDNCRDQIEQLMPYVY